jgi:hypothetical protein
MMMILRNRITSMMMVIMMMMISKILTIIEFRIMSHCSNPIYFHHSAYDRCKANHRCNWGIVETNQSQNSIAYYQRLFSRGTLYKVDLFLDFEDWRTGTRGLNMKGEEPPYLGGATAIRGAHFNPFDELSSTDVTYDVDGKS